MPLANRDQTVQSLLEPASDSQSQVLGFQDSPTVAATSHTPGITVFVSCLAMIITIQVFSGAYLMERGAWSDDAAHFMNGLLIRDYLTSAIGQDPMTFAEAYYLSYPKIAPLMWPPLFHVTLGLFLLPGWPPGYAALVLVALIATWLAWRLHRIVTALCTRWARWLAPLLVVMTPLVASMSGVVMLDIAIAACSLEAASWLAKYWQTTNWKHAAGFGFFCALACLTKGNGAALVLAPPFLIFLTGRYDLLRRGGLYVAALIVLVLGVPLLAVSASYDAGLGDFAMVTASQALFRVQFYSVHLWRELGPGVISFSLLGAFVVLLKRRERRGPLPMAAALLSVIMASAVFHVFNPHKVADPRYLTVAVAPMIGLAFFGVWDTARRAHPVYWREAMRGIMAALIVLSTLAARPTPGVVRPIGYRTLVATMIRNDQLAGRRVLVVSDEIGEGAFVSEAAVAKLTPAPTIVRGSKMLGSDSWNGEEFRLIYPSAVQLQQDIEAMHIEYVVLDLSDLATRLPYFSQIKTVAEEHLTQAGLFPRGAARASRSLALYRVPTQSPGPPKPVPARTTGKPR